jgi:fructose-1,6-bisphosphatase/inositol monophosphatase family enzyme
MAPLPIGITATRVNATAMRGFMKDRLAFALDLARRAGTMIISGLNCEEKDIQVRTKADGTPVTNYDFQVDDYVQSAIASRFPHDYYVSEENGQELRFCGDCWICDPIDGTSHFIAREDGSAFILAFMRSGIMEFVVALLPQADKLFYAARGQGAFCEDALLISKQAHTTQSYGLRLANGHLFGERLHIYASTLAGGIVPFGRTVDKRLPRQMEAAGALLAQVHGSANKYLMLTRNEAVAVIKENPDPFDSATCALIVTEAGGVVVGFDGEPLDWRQRPAGIVMAAPDIISEVLSALEG